MTTPAIPKPLITSTRDRIRAASTVEKVVEIVTKAEAFEYISTKSLRRIKTAATNRIAILTAASPCK